MCQHKETRVFEIVNHGQGFSEKETIKWCVDCGSLYTDYAGYKNSEWTDPKNGYETFKAGFESGFDSSSNDLRVLYKKFLSR